MFKKEKMFRSLLISGSPFTKVNSVIRTASKYGGFVAGGFARKLYLMTICETTMEEIKRDYTSFATGDVDLFFENDEQILLFLKDINFPEELINSTIDYQQSVALEYHDVNDNHSFRKTKYTYTFYSGAVKVQVINSIKGSMTEVLDTFDIKNCKVAYKSGIVFDDLVYDDAIAALEKNRQIHVDSWNSQLVFGRLLKYLYQKNLFSLTQESMNQLPHAIIECLSNISEYSENQFGDWGCTSRQIIINFVNNFLYNVLNKETVSNDDIQTLLLLASFNLKRPGYEISDITEKIVRRLTEYKIKSLVK